MAIMSWSDVIVMSSWSGVIAMESWCGIGGLVSWASCQGSNFFSLNLRGSARILNRLKVNDFGRTTYVTVK